MILTIAAVVVALFGGSVYAVWKSHEEAKADRLKFQRIAQANSESRGWPIPPGPKGFGSRRRAA